MENQGNVLHYDYQTFLSKFDSELATEDRVVGVFLASIEPETGKYWCPDCESTKDTINDVLVPHCKANNVKVVFVDVGDKPTWKDPQHPLRTHTPFSVTNIPTVGLFEKVKG